MTTPTEAVFAVLNAHAGIQALVGNGDSPETYRIYPILMPQDSAVPTITFTRVSAERELTMSDAGGNGVDRSRIRVTSWGKTLAETQALAEQIRQAMYAATTFEALQVFEADDFESDTLLYSTVTDYSVWYHY